MEERDQGRLVLNEGFAVVNRRGDVIPIDRRTTGARWDEIQNCLRQVERRRLVSVGEARDIMADANRAEVRKKKRVERDAARKSPDPDPAVQSFDPELPGCFDQNLIFATSAYKERESAFKWLSSLRVRGIGLETACDQFAE